MTSRHAPFAQVDNRFRHRLTANKQSQSDGNAIYTDTGPAELVSTKLAFPQVTCANSTDTGQDLVGSFPDRTGSLRRGALCPALADIPYDGSCILFVWRLSYGGLGAQAVAD